MDENRKFFIDDRCIIPEDIKKMPREQLDKEIAELEAQARINKERILASETQKRKMA